MVGSIRIQTNLFNPPYPQCGERKDKMRLSSPYFHFRPDKPGGQRAEANRRLDGGESLLYLEGGAGCGESILQLPGLGRELPDPHTLQPDHTAGQHTRHTRICTLQCSIHDQYVPLTHQWLKYFFLNFEVKIEVLVALYVWTLLRVKRIFC